MKKRTYAEKEECNGGRTLSYIEKPVCKSAMVNSFKQKRVAFRYALSSQVGQSVL